MRKRNIMATVLLLTSCASLYGYQRYQMEHRDILGPSIQIENQTIEVSVSDGEKVLKEGVTASDQKDGDVTDSIVIENISEFTSEGSRRVDYAAFDSDYHVSKASRSIVYRDYTSPHFQIEEALRFPVTKYGDLNILGRVQAQDCIDGDISDQITFTPDSHISVDIASDYHVSLQVTNSAGDVQELPVTVSIYDPEEERLLPKIVLKNYVIYTKVGKKIDLRSNIKEMIYQGEEYQLTEEGGIFGMDEDDYRKLLKEAEEKDEELVLTVNQEDFQIKKKIDYKNPGVYQASYTIDDADGNRGKAILTVVVEE